jgi:4-alpha-glucanotransferase
MNLPGRASGNWGWRFSWDQITPEIVERLRTMIAVYER